MNDIMAKVIEIRKTYIQTGFHWESVTLILGNNNIKQTNYEI